MKPRMQKRLITSSRLKSVRTCQRLHHIEYELGYRPLITSEALQFGTLIHVGLEAWWKAMQRAAGPDEALAAAIGAMTEHGVSSPYERVKAEVLLAGYSMRWGSEPYEVLAVEREFVTDLVNPVTKQPSRTFALAGKIDVIVRDRRTGRVLVIEHKTSSEDISQGADYWRRLRMDSQISIYYSGTRSLGFDVDGCLYDVLGKLKIKPLLATPEPSRKFTKKGELYANQREQDETPDEFRQRCIEAIAADPTLFYQRGEVVRLEEDMAEAQWDVWTTAKQIHEANRAGLAPRNTDACHRYNRLCPYFDVCSRVTSLENPLQFKRIETIHPELNEAANE